MILHGSGSGGHGLYEDPPLELVDVLLELVDVPLELVDVPLELVDALPALLEETLEPVDAPPLPALPVAPPLPVPREPPPAPEEIPPAVAPPRALASPDESGEPPHASTPQAIRLKLKARFSL
jgi:hypothetical protein